MSIAEKFYFVKDDFEVIERLRKLPPSVQTENQQILKYIQEKAYGQDFGTVISDFEYTYVVYKFGNINDSGLFMVYVKNEDMEFLKMYVERAADVLPNPEIRMKMLDVLTKLSLNNPFL